MTDHNADFAHGLEPVSPEKTPEVDEIDTQSTVASALKNISLAESPADDASQASIQATDGYSDSGSQHGQGLPELHLYHQTYPAGPMHYEHSQGQADFRMTSQPAALQNHSGNLAYPYFCPPVSGYPRYAYDPRMLPQCTSTEQPVAGFNGPSPPQYPHQAYVAYPMGSYSQPTAPYTRGPTPYSPPNYMMHSQDHNASQPTTAEANAPCNAGRARVKQEGKHPCTVCAKRFLRPSALLTHNRTHTGEKPYRCRYAGCDRSLPEKAFSVLSNKTRHEKTAHKEWYKANAASLNQRSARNRNSPVNCLSEVSGVTSSGLSVGN